MNERTLFTAAALLGLVLRNERRHGVEPKGAAALAAEAIELGKATAEAYGADERPMWTEADLVGPKGSKSGKR